MHATHRCSCAHIEVRYCAPCGVTHCLSCKQEWVAPCTRAHYDLRWSGPTYGYNGLAAQQYASIPLGVPGTDTTPTITCTHVEA